LAHAVGADLVLMERQAKQMRNNGPVIMAQVKNMMGIPDIVAQIFSKMPPELTKEKRK